MQFDSHIPVQEVAGSSKRNSCAACLAGATGYVGREVAKLVSEAGISTTALVRPSAGGGSDRKAILDALESSGVKPLEGTLDGTVQELADVLKPYDTIVSMLNGERVGARGWAILLSRGTVWLRWLAVPMLEIFVGDTRQTDPVRCSPLPVCADWHTLTPPEPPSSPSIGTWYCRCSWLIIYTILCGLRNHPTQLQGKTWRLGS